MKNKEAFLSAYNYGMKSDILRYEILHSYGGVYIDTDYECVMNIGKCTTHNLLDVLFLFLSSIILREYLLLFFFRFSLPSKYFFCWNIEHISSGNKQWISRVTFASFVFFFLSFFLSFFLTYLVILIIICNVSSAFSSFYFH
jgi:Glycosyltransferase sugar-binding region containing DXD motif